MFTKEEANPEAIIALASSLHVPSYDLLVVGDGAGNLATTPYGWACATYSPGWAEVRWLWGGGSGGTNNVAELEPAVQGVSSYRAALLADYLARGPNDGGAPVKSLKVVIVSDSEMTVKCGQGLYERRANAPYWASVEWFERKGYQLTWRWVPRNSNVFNCAADRVAKAVRAAMGASNLGVTK